MALGHCSDILVQRGRFRQAADRQKGMAELFREDPNRLDQGLAAYDRAATWYQQEGATAYVSFLTTALRRRVSARPRSWPYSCRCIPAPSSCGRPWRRRV